jgi:hypothetical protein
VTLIDKLTELWPYIQTVGGVAVGVLGKWFLDWLRAKHDYRLKDRELDIKEDDQDAKQDLAISDQLLKNYNDLFNRMEKRIVYLEEMVIKLEVEHKICSEDNIKLKAALATQEIRIDEQQREIIRLQLGTNNAPK